MFINFSNHNSAYWSPAQREAANKYGDIVDIPFPQVPAGYGEEDITRLADECTDRIIGQDPVAVMCQGEFTLAYAVVTRLMAHGVKCLAACSDRNVEETPGSDGAIVKNAVYKFVRFRDYVK